MTGWYTRRMVPHIVRIGCGCAALGPLRERIICKARGRVLDIGFGAGANLGYYDRDKLSELVGVEPSEQLRAIAKAAAKKLEFPITLHEAAAERLPFADGSFDTVVSSFTLCSVEDPGCCLKEIKRVLKPDGRLLFCEHGLAPDPAVSKWQRRVEPWWTPVFGGCRLTRPVRGNIEAIFKLAEWNGTYQNGRRSLAGWMEWGEACP